MAKAKIDLQDEIVKVLKTSEHWVPQSYEGGRTKDESFRFGFPLLFSGNIEAQVVTDLQKIATNVQNIWIDDKKGVLGFRGKGSKKYFLFKVSGFTPVQQLVMALYWDGEQVRGIVPNAGNNYNPKNNAAFDMSKEDDLQYLKTLGHEFMDDWEFGKSDSIIADGSFVDIKAIIKEIENNI